MNGLVLTVVLAAAILNQVDGLLQCLKCRAGHSMRMCSTVTCQSDEMCHAGDVIHLFKPAHVAGCLSASECGHLNTIIMQLMHSQSFGSGDAFGRKRSLHMCDICCGNDMCNKESCNQIKHKLYSMYATNSLNMTTMSLTEPANHSTTGH